MSARFHSIILTTKNVSKSLGFYTEALGLKTSQLSEEIAEMKDPAGFTVILKRSDSLAFCTRGFSPVITWEISDFNERLDRITKYGAELDGDVTETPSGKLVCFKAPDGHMMALKEYSPVSTEPDEEEEESPVTEEIKRLLKKIKV
jgi:predicted enzyme related to lactoylglutathione lyase